jgi:hypothetical protein
LPAQDKSRLSREIAGLMFTAEATALSINNHARILCLRIKTHAHNCATENPPKTPAEHLWQDYETLESLLEKGS